MTARKILKILNNTVLLALVEKCIRFIVGFLLVGMITRYLGASSYGLWNYYLSYLYLLSFIATLGLESLFNKYYLNEHYHPDKTFSNFFVLRLVGTLALVTIFIATLLSINETIDIVTMILVAISAGQFPCEIIEMRANADGYVRSITKIRFISLLIGALLKVAVILLKIDWHCLVAITTLEIIWVNIFIYYHYRYFRHFKFSFLNQTILKKIIKESSPFIFASLSVALYMRLDQIMLEKMTTLAQVGVYSAAVRVCESTYILPMLLSTLFAPLIMKNINKENSFIEVVSGYYLLNIGASVIASGAAIIFFTYIGEFFFGETFVGIRTTGIILALSIPFTFLGVATSQFVIASGEYSLSMYRTMGGFVVNLFLNLLFIPKWGAIGASVASLIAYGTALGLTFMSAQFRVHIYNVFLYLRKTNWMTITKQSLSDSQWGSGENK